MAIGIVKDDKAVFTKGYGLRELGKPEPVDENTLFAVASNSKAFTTASLAILVDEKKLAWDDKVSKYLPDLRMYDPYVTSELTIRDLVTHRIGLDTFNGDLLWYRPNDGMRRNTEPRLDQDFTIITSLQGHSDLTSRKPRAALRVFAGAYLR